MRCRFLHKEAIFDFQMMFHIFSSFSSIQILKRNMGVWISYFTKIHTSSIWTESVNYTKKMWYLRELCIVSALKLSILLHVVQVGIGMFDAPYFVHPLLFIHWRRKAFYSSNSRGDNHEGSYLIFGKVIFRRTIWQTLRNLWGRLRQRRRLAQTLRLLRNSFACDRKIWPQI